jgi:hypothetical protein
MDHQLNQTTTTMAKYHITIESDYWTRNVTGFMQLSPEQRSQTIRQTTDRIQEFLEREDVPGTAQLMITDETVKVDPLGDVTVACQ